jgi:4-hydroxythreonine-4-phosphate dehydrogenase
MTPARALALTMGEPAGIGGEISLKAWLGDGVATPAFFVIDDPARLQRLADGLDLAVPVRAIDAPADATDVFAECLPVLPRPLGADAVPGVLDASNAGAVRTSIETAVALVQKGEAAAVVTNPIHKEVLYSAGFGFPGHTEFLAALAGISTPPVMMLASPRLRVVPVTIHVSVAEAVETLRTADIVEKAMICATALGRDFGITRPRLAVAGLNPHASEGGGMGSEDTDIVAPAVAELQRRGIDAVGPMPSDTLFHARARSTYDAAICMYHDQALIPIKTVDFDGAVNVTLGLPFVRTSPDHGTALDIAGTGAAKPTSLLAALRMAADMAARRAAVADA